MKRIRIKKEHLFIDRFQGRDENDRSFGFIGLQIQNYKPKTYCGMFFTYPGIAAKVKNGSEIDLIVSSLKYDETTYRPEIPHVPVAMARKLLRSQCEQMLREYQREQEKSNGTETTRGNANDQ